MDHIKKFDLIQINFVHYIWILIKNQVSQN